jgi:hypothetical protein
MKASIIKMGAISAILIAALVALPLVGAKNQTSYTFTLKGPNTSEAEVNRPPTHVVAEDLLRLTGSGTFDTSTGAISGGGSFEHLKPDGQGGFFVHGKGLWTVKEFVSFTSYGGPSSGKQGGLLIIRVEAKSTWSVHWAETGSETLNLMFKISSEINAPAGAPAEGVDIWGGPNYILPLFGIVDKGSTQFHLNK